MTRYAPPSRPRRAAALLAALAVLLAGSPSASADTAGELDAAKDRLRALQGKITAEEAEVGRLSSQLGSLVQQVGVQQAGVDETRAELGRTEARIRHTRDELAELRERIGARARDLYKHGTLDVIDLILGAKSLGDLADRIMNVTVLVRQDSAMVGAAERLQGELEAQQAEQQELLRQEQSRLRALEGERRRLNRVFAAQQDRIAQLARDRAEALDLVERLEQELAAEQLAEARRIAGKGMPITFGQWAESFLPSLGAPVTRNNLVLVVAWETAEYTQATWNPLATTMPMPGATVYNSHGVRNYLSKEQGIEATIKTLRRPGHGYEKIVANLLASSESMTTARAVRDSDWCAGCANGNYVVGLIEAVEEYYDRYASR